MIGLDPVAIRKELEVQRIQGLPFDRAWLIATGYQTQTTDERHLLTFMRWHFEAAYNRSTSPRGRCNVPDRDVSAAVAKSGSIPRVVSDHRRCRSGDDCEREATRGRFGRKWCEYHGAELERLGGKLNLEISLADPRNGGNKSLYTHKAA